MKFQELLISILIAAGTFVLCAESTDASCYDSAMARTEGGLAAEDVRWIDGKELPLEGRAFVNTEHYYDRLPQGVSTNVNAGVRNMKHLTAGMQFRFKTDSKRLRFRWIPYRSSLSMDHMPASGVSGIDVYRWDEKANRWLYVRTGRIWDAKKGGALDFDWIPGTPCLVNLPLYNGVKSFRLGVDLGSSVTPLPARKSGIVKPVVFYGTSITQGGCCSRPGISYPSAVGRELDVPIVNLGFSGSAKAEPEIAELLTRIDAGCYVIDCIRNMSVKLIKKRYERFVREILAARPLVPIVLVEGCNAYGNSPQGQDIRSRSRAVTQLYQKLRAEGFKNVYLITEEEQLGDDFEGTVDGVHPNDLGMARMTEAFKRGVGKALGIK